VNCEARETALGCKENSGMINKAKLFCWLLAVPLQFGGQAGVKLQSSHEPAASQLQLQTGASKEHTPPLTRHPSPRGEYF